MRTGYETPVAIEDKASLSQNLDGSFSLRGISAGLLRGAKRTEMSIKDAYTGEVVFTKTTYNSRKAYGASGSGGMVDVNFNVAELGLANNKKYTFEMECFLDVEGEQSPSRNTFSFSFYIDNEAPVLVPDETVIKYDTDSTTGKSHGAISSWRFTTIIIFRASSFRVTNQSMRTVRS